MADHFVRFYAFDASVLPKGGNSFSWTGGDVPFGTATITDNETGIEGQTLDDTNGGETATANVSIGGLTSTGTAVHSETVWTVQDSVTGEIFEIVQFSVTGGGAAGEYTLSETPLIDGRVYDVLARETKSDVTGGDEAFTYGDYVAYENIIDGTSGNDVLDSAYTGDPEGSMIDNGAGTGTSDMGDIVFGYKGDDTISSGAGGDTVYGGSGADTINGGAGADTIYGGDGATVAATSEFLSWSSQAPDEADLRGGFTQNTGEIDVTVSFTDDGNNNALFTVESTDTEYVGAGEPMSTTSAGYMYGNGDAETETVRIDFAAASGSALADEVENVQFRVNDIDWGANNHTDRVTVNAYDASGNPVSVVITAGGGDTVDAATNTVTAENVAEGLDDLGGSALFEISGPVSYIEISYFNVQDGTHGVGITDIHFDTMLAADGNDIITGGTGADTIFGEGGDDTIYLAQGDTADGGTGDDTFVITDLGDTGTITVTGGEGGETLGDTLDFNGLLAPKSVAYTNPNDAAGGLSGTATLLDGTTVNFSNIETIICFTSGTGILTPQGERPIETLQAGDMVVTRDHGSQRVRWIGNSTVPGSGQFAPVKIVPSALNRATRPLIVSPQHRVLIHDYRAELMFGEPEVLVSAKHMIDGTNARAAPIPFVSYIHLMLDQHQIIYANGVATESFLAADGGMAALAPRAREEMFAVFPQLRSDTALHGVTARRCLKGHEAGLLMDMLTTANRELFADKAVLRAA